MTIHSLQSPWQLRQGQGHLDGPVRLTVDLHQPGQGVRVESLRGFPAGPAGHALGWILAPGEASVSARVLEDQYVRGSDLVASYAASPADPVGRRCYWRWFPYDPLGGIDLILAVHTGQLDSQPGMRTCSQLAGSELYFLPSGGQGEFVRWREDGLLRGGEAHGVYVIRPGDAPDISYAEMVHPADFCQTEVTCGDGRIALTQSLFGGHLEKGVIRLSRIRAVWLPRSQDLVLARAVHRAMLDTPPPLTT